MSAAFFYFECNVTIDDAIVAAMLISLRKR